MLVRLFIFFCCCCCRCFYCYGGEMRLLKLSGFVNFKNKLTLSALTQLVLGASSQVSLSIFSFFFLVWKIWESRVRFEPITWRVSDVSHMISRINITTFFDLPDKDVSTVHPSSSVLHILKSPLNLNRARCYKVRYITLTILHVEKFKLVVFLLSMVTPN